MKRTWRDSNTVGVDACLDVGGPTRPPAMDVAGYRTAVRRHLVPAPICFGTPNRGAHVVDLISHVSPTQNPL